MLYYIELLDIYLGSVDVYDSDRVRRTELSNQEHSYA